ncbi:MAG: potassium transporter TrkG, partial [Oscillospiraceae bacterium]
VSPMQMIVSSFFAVIAFGTLMLMMPFATYDGEITFINALFTATSATCVTGLVVYDTFTKFTIFGKCVIITMIQVGGLGLVTFTTFFSMVLGRRLGLHSLKLASENSNTSSFAQMRTFINKVMKITFTCEGIGMLLLCCVLVPKFGLSGIPMSAFTAISAFCNAGFDLFGFLGQYSSLTTFSGNPFILGVISALIISGGLGFIAWQEILAYRKTKKFSLHSKLVFLITGILIVSGTVLFALLEWHNTKTIGTMGFFDKISNSMFQSISARTAGFNSVDLASASDMTKMVMSVLMFIGTAPGGTGGGIKVTTIAILVVTVISVIRGRDETTIFGRQIDKKIVYRSLAITMLGAGAVVCAILAVF